MMTAGDLMTRRCAVSKGKAGVAMVKCAIERSPFSDQRIFTLKMPENREHVGTASYIYFTRAEDQRLKEDEPAPGKAVSGKVEAIVIREENGTCVVALPDGSVVSVPKSAVKVSKEAPSDVSIQP